MRINVRGGLFRLWIVLATVWAIVVCSVSFRNVRDEFKKAESMRKINAMGFKPDLPVDCASARGQAGDYRRDEKKNLCWYDMRKFRVLFPEYKDLDERQALRCYLQESRHTADAHPTVDSISGKNLFGVGSADPGLRYRIVVDVGARWLSQERAGKWPERLRLFQ